VNGGGTIVEPQGSVHPDGYSPGWPERFIGDPYTHEVAYPERISDSAIFLKVNFSVI